MVCSSCGGVSVTVATPRKRRVESSFTASNGTLPFIDPSVCPSTMMRDAPNCPAHPPVKSEIIADHAKDGWRVELLTLASLLALPVAAQEVPPAAEGDQGRRGEDEGGDADARRDGGGR